MDRMACLLSLFLSCLAISTAFSCTDEPSPPAEQDNTPPGADDTADDDDDLLDDDLDDDAIDDDDSVDDDDNDDDNDDQPFENITVYDDGELSIELVAGGGPGHSGISSVLLPDDRLAVAAIKGRSLKVYYVTDQDITAEIVAHYALAPTAALDPDGVLHIVYQDWRDERLVFASETARGWTFEKIDDYSYPPVNPQHRSSLAFDTTGHGHVTYMKPDEAVVYYATNANRSWSIEIVDAGEGDFFEHPTLALDASGTPHIAYSLIDGDVWHAVRDEGGWRTDKVDGWGNFRDPKLRIGPDGKMQILYFSDGGLRLAWYLQNKWATRDIETPGWVEEHGFVVNEDNIVNFSFWDDQKNLWFAQQDDTQWVFELLKSSPTENRYAPINYLDLCPKGGGAPIIVFADREDGVIGSLAREQGSWEEMIIDHTPNAAGATVAVDSQGNPHVGLAVRGKEGAADEETCWYGVKTDKWRYEFLSPGRIPVIAIDENDRSHASIWNAQDLTLNYATNAGGDWEVVEVPQAPWPFPNDPFPHLTTTIAIDREGNPAIAAVGDYATTDNPWGDLAQLMFGRGPEWDTEEAMVFNHGTGFSLSLLFNLENEPRVVVGHWWWDFWSDFEYVGMFYPLGEDWTWEPIHWAGELRRVGHGSDAALDEDGTVFVSYSTDFFGVMLATGDLVPENGDWQRRDLPDLAAQLTPTAVALSPEGYPVVVSTQYDSFRDIRVGALTPSGWRFAVVDRGDGYGSARVDIAVDSQGIVHVVYDGASGEDAVWHARFPISYILGK